MKVASATGMVCTDACMPLVIREISVRTEITKDLRSLSLSDDRVGIMIEIGLNPEVKKLLKELVK